MTQHTLETLRQAKLHQTSELFSVFVDVHTKYNVQKLQLPAATLIYRDRWLRRVVYHRQNGPHTPLT